MEDISEKDINLHWQKIIKYITTFLGFSFQDTLNLTLPQICVLFIDPEESHAMIPMSYQQILKHIQKVRSGVQR